MTDYRNYQPEKTSRERENIEWSITYTYDSQDTASPRILLIGDSICHGYQKPVRGKLGDKANVTFWVTSKCVTDPDYFRELDFVIGDYHYDFVSFNNGLHSLTTDPGEWAVAFDAAVRYLKDRLPEAKFVVTLSTPLRNAELNEKVIVLNECAKKAAEANGVAILDLYTPMAALDQDEAHSDDFHFKEPTRNLQGKIVCAYVAEQLDLENIGLVQEGTGTAPSGALK